MKSSREFPIVRIRAGEREARMDSVVVEYTLLLFVNGAPYVHILCSPMQLRELVYGYLFAEGLIAGAADVQSFALDEENARCTVELANPDAFRIVADVPEAVRTVTTACGKQHSIAYQLMNDVRLQPLTDTARFSFAAVMEQVNQFNKESVLFQETGGVHSCALCDGRRTLVFMEDIGRHNAFDKVLGYALLHDIPLAACCLLTSGRVPSDMVVKAVNARIPLIVSRSAPTDAAVELANKHHVTLCGFARGNRLNVYTAKERIEH